MQSSAQTPMTHVHAALSAGAVGYVPLCFVLPCVMWLKTHRGSLSALQVATHYAVIAISCLVAVLASIGSVRSLIVNASSYTFFS